MKVLMISTDRNICDETSAVAQRMISYGQYVDQLHIIVFSRKSHRLSQKRLGKNVWVYPTSSLSRLLYMMNACTRAWHILSHVEYPTTGWVVTTQDPFETGLVGRRIMRRVGIPLHVQIHTDIGSPYFAQSFLNRVRLYIARRVIPEADRIRVVSGRIKNTLTTEYGVDDDRIDVLPIYVDVSENVVHDDIHHAYPQFETIILMASRLTHEKNIPCALEAFSQVSAQHPAAGMVIVGSGPEEERLKQVVYKHGIVDKVVFEGWKNDMSGYFHSADIFLLTSDYEGYGRTLIESAAGGTAIVSTDVGVVGEVFSSGEDVRVCPPRDVECVSVHLSQLLASPDTRTRLGESARAHARAHGISQDDYYQQYVHTLMSTVKHSRI